VRKVLALQDMLVGLADSRPGSGERFTHTFKPNGVFLLLQLPKWNFK